MNLICNLQDHQLPSPAMANIRNLVLDPRWSHVRTACTIEGEGTIEERYPFLGWVTVVTTPASLQGPEETTIQPVFFLTDDGRTSLWTPDEFLADEMNAGGGLKKVTLTWCLHSEAADTPQFKD